MRTARASCIHRRVRELPSNDLVFGLSLNLCKTHLPLKHSLLKTMSAQVGTFGCRSSRKDHKPVQNEKGVLLGVQCFMIPTHTLCATIQQTMDELSDVQRT